MASSDFLGRTWPNLTQNSKHFQIWCICKMKDTLVTEKNILSDWTSSLFVSICGKLFLVYYCELRQWFNKICRLKGRIKNIPVNCSIFYVYLSIVKWIFLLIFSWKAAKISRTVWGERVHFFSNSGSNSVWN